MNDRKRTSVTVAGALIVGAAIGFAAASCDEKRDVSQKSSEASVVTNDNGSVSRTFTECTITTNGSMVTEHRRETRTTLDTEGNMLESSTSEYAQSYSVGDFGVTTLTPSINAKVDKEAPAAHTESPCDGHAEEEAGGSRRLLCLRDAEDAQGR